MPTYEVAYWYSTRSTVVLEAASPEAAEQLARQVLLGELPDEYPLEGLGEDAYLEEWRTEGAYQDDAYAEIPDRPWQQAQLEATACA